MPSIEEQTRTRATLAAWFAGASLVISLLTMFIPHKASAPEPKGTVSKGRVSDPPVLISGGSMTFRAQQAWNCISQFPTSTCTSGDSNIDTTEIDVDGLRAASGPDPIAWADLAGKSWQIILWARDGGGAVAKVKRVVLCPVVSGACGAASQGTPIMIRTSKPDNTALNLLNAPVPIAEDTGVYAVRYQENPLIANGDDPPQEHIGEVDVQGVDNTTGYTYTCVHAACRIYIG